MKHRHLFEVDGKVIEVQDYFKSGEELQKWASEGKRRYFDQLGYQQVKKTEG